MKTKLSWLTGAVLVLSTDLLRKLLRQLRTLFTILNSTNTLSEINSDLLRLKIVNRELMSNLLKTLTNLLRDVRLTSTLLEHFADLLHELQLEAIKRALTSTLLKL
nr:hypothetical protein Iba_chr12cCG21320 [Ipomoea batatas]